MSILDIFAEKHGCIIGACDATPLDESHYGGFTPFVSADIKKRTDPAAVLPGATGVIAIGVGLGKTIDKEPFVSGGAQLSSLGTSPDYHPHVRAILRELANELKQHYDFKHKILVDSPNLDERAFAVRAGLGFLGRNGLVISQKFGSRFNIGLIVHDIKCFDVEGFDYKNQPLQDVCPPNCRLCINACPSPSSCISYLTQKKELSADEEILLVRGNQLYGCDICQNICPHNAECETNFINPRIWLSMDDEALAEKYSYTAMLWQGTAILRRNAHILLSSLDNTPPKT